MGRISIVLPPEVTQTPNLSNHWDRNEMSVITAVINNKSRFSPPRSPSCGLIGYRVLKRSASSKVTSNLGCLHVRGVGGGSSASPLLNDRAFLKLA